jgi:hypothetical protein
MVAYLKKKPDVTLVTLCDVRSAPWKFSSHFHVEDSRLLGLVAVLLGEHFPTFRKSLVPGFITQLHSRTLSYGAVVSLHCLTMTMTALKPLKRRELLTQDTSSCTSSTPCKNLKIQQRLPCSFNKDVL